MITNLFRYSSDLWFPKTGARTINDPGRQSGGVSREEKMKQLLSLAVAAAVLVVASAAQAEFTLDSRYTDADGDLIADIPTDASKLSTPSCSAAKTLASPVPRVSWACSRNGVPWSSS